MMTQKASCFGFIILHSAFCVHPFLALCALCPLWLIFFDYFAGRRA
jgi:hypothetical protein